MIECRDFSVAPVLVKWSLGRQHQTYLAIIMIDDNPPRGEMRRISASNHWQEKFLVIKLSVY